MDQKLYLRLETENTNFRGQSWSLQWPDIALFDTTFVHRNVYAGDYVDHDHKKNLYHVMVGEVGVTLSKRVNELDNKIRELNKEISFKQSTAQSFIPKSRNIRPIPKIAQGRRH